MARNTVCMHDAAQVVTSLGFDYVGLGAWDAVGNFSRLLRSGGNWEPIANRAAASFSLAPGTEALRDQWNDRHGAPVPLTGGWGTAYYAGGFVPVLGSGLALGEAINSCGAAIRYP